MKDILLLLTAILLSYLFFMGIVVFLVKALFPFLTKEELEKRENLSSLKG